MAMAFREGNQVKWVGTRPGHNGVQILESGMIANGEAILYTVLAGQRFFWTWFSFSIHGNADGNGYLYIYDDGPAIWRTVVRAFNKLDVSANYSFSSMNPPIELLPEYSVRLVSDSLGTAVSCCIHGWAEDA